MSPLPAQMINRWQNREEPGPGQGTLYWHILVGGYSEVRDLAHAAQERLAGFPGLHMIPIEWLHITALRVGSADEITDSQQQDMVATASEHLAEVQAIAVALGRILYHPEAIALAVRPVEPLNQIREAVQTATLKVTCREGYAEGPGGWTPHVTIAYSETDQPAAPFISALHPDLPNQEITISAVTLVIQRGPERLWDWYPVGQANLADTL